MNKQPRKCKVCELDAAVRSDFCGVKHRLFYYNFRNGIDNLKCLEKQKKREYTATQVKAFNAIKALLKDGKI